MAMFSHRTITTVRHEWSVPATEPWGAPADEVGKAWTAAAAAYREAHNIPEDTPIAGNALTVHVADDAIVIRFTHDTPGGAR